MQNIKESRAHRVNKEAILNQVKGLIRLVKEHRITAAWTLAIFTTLVTITYVDNNTHVSAAEAWRNPVSQEGGTVPEPTPTVEDEPLELGNFNAVAKTEPGVMVAFVHSPTGESDVLDDKVDLNTWAYSIAPTTNLNGRSHPEQFPPSGKNGIMVGQIAENFWQYLIDKYRDEGDEQTAHYLETHYGEIKPISDGEILINNLRSGEGEDPLEIRAQLVTNADGQQTMIFSYSYPDYRAQSPEGGLHEVGEDYGMLEPITTTPEISLDQGISVTFKPGNDPLLEVSNDGETIAVSSAPVVQVAAFNDVEDGVEPPLGDIQVSAVNELMLNRNEYFRQLVIQTEGNPENMNQIATIASAPTELPEGSRKLSLIIKGTEMVSKDGTYLVNFGEGPDGKQLAVLLTDLLPTDEVKIKIVVGKVVLENLSETNHLPTATIFGNPEEPVVTPTPVETETPTDPDPTESPEPNPSETPEPGETPTPEDPDNPNNPGETPVPGHVYTIDLHLPSISR